MPKRPIRRHKFWGLNIANPKVCAEEEEYLEAFDIQNIVLSHKAGFKVRPGFQKLNGATVLPATGHSADWFVDYDNNPFLVIGTGTEVYVDPDGGGNPVVSKTGLTSNLRTNNCVQSNFLWHVNGTDGNLKFDGATWSSLGIAAPAAAPTVADGGVGVLDGTYQHIYVYVYKNPTFPAGTYESESAISDNSEITVATKQIDVTYVADPSGEATHIRIYRRSNTALQFQLVTEVVDGSGTYADNTADADLGRAIQYPFEGAPPVAFDGICSWQNRLWGWKGKDLYFTREDRPEYWYLLESDYSKFTIDRGNADIVHCHPFGHQLVILTDDHPYAIIGNHEDNFELQGIPGLAGCVAPRSVVDCGHLMWVAKDGVYEFDGYSQPKERGEPVGNDFAGNSKGILDSTLTALNHAAGIYLDDESIYWLSCPFSASLFNSRTFSYDFNLKKPDDLSGWALHSFGRSDFVVTHDKRIIGLSATDGYYYLENAGELDDATTISAYYETKHYDFDVQDFDKIMLYISVAGFTTGDPIDFYSIFDFGNFTDLVTLTETGDTWDDPAAGKGWDGAVWSGSNLISIFQSCPRSCVGQYIGFRIEMTRDGAFYGYHTQLSEKRRKQR